MTSAPVHLVIQRMSEEIQKDVEMMGTLRQAGVQPGISGGWPSPAGSAYG